MARAAARNALLLAPRRQVVDYRKLLVEHRIDAARAVQHPVGVVIGEPARAANQRAREAL